MSNNVKQNLKWYLKSISLIFAIELFFAHLGDSLYHRFYRHVYKDEDVSNKSIFELAAYSVILFHVSLPFIMLFIAPFVACLFIFSTLIAMIPEKYKFSKDTQRKFTIMFFVCGIAIVVILSSTITIVREPVCFPHEEHTCIPSEEHEQSLNEVEIAHKEL